MIIRVNRMENAKKKRFLKGINILIIVGFAFFSYGIYEIGLRAGDLIYRNQYIQRNYAQVIYRSNNYNAFPKIQKLQDNDLWVVWYQGDWHVDTHNDGKLMQTISNDNGTTWRHPEVLYDDPFYDTQMGAIGELPDGTLISSYVIYNASSGKILRTEWIKSSDKGLTWSPPKILSQAQFNPVGLPNYIWIYPYGNIFNVSGEYFASFYGNSENNPGSQVQDVVILLKYNATFDNWSYVSTVMAYSARGFNEADIEYFNGYWLCLSRSSEDRLYYSYSQDSFSWSTPVETIYALGHAPELVFLKVENNIAKFFCSFRGESGFLRGGLAYFDLVSKTFTCENLILYAAQGKGGSDAGYSSGILLSPQEVGLVNYEVIVCGESGSPNTTGTILWQTWSVD